MRFSATSIVLAALAAGEAAAASISHHAGKHNHAARHAQLMEAQEEAKALANRDVDLLSAADLGKIKALGLQTAGVNSLVPGSNAWIGNTGPYTNEFINQSGEDLVLVVWGVAGSWVNVNTPLITVSIPNQSSKTLSFPSGSTGAWSPIYASTKLVMGQISETWGEYTFGPTGVVDVSREVNMGGRGMSIVGPTCTTDMNTCVFVCPNGQQTCMTGYQLLNCGPGSQPGANYGVFEGSPSGGCGNMGSGAALKTYLG